MELTNSLKKEFIKNFDLPIQLVQEPYFSYALKQLDPYFDCINKYEQWVIFVNQFSKQDEVFSYLNNVLEQAINFVKNLDGYKQFNQMKMDKFQIQDKSLKSQNLYLPENANKEFYSIDLKEANFQALKIVVPELKEFKSFKDFISNFTNNAVLLESKKLRQVILGNLNPARQQTIQKYIINQIYNDLLSQGVNSDCIKSSSADELIVDSVAKFKLSSDNVKVEKFKLELVHPNFSYYVKKSDNKIKFKNVPSMNLLEVVKFYNKQEVCDFDLCFYYEKRVAKFQQSLFYATSLSEVSED